MTRKWIIGLSLGAAAGVILQLTLLAAPQTPAAAQVPAPDSDRRVALERELASFQRERDENAALRDRLQRLIAETQARLDAQAQAEPPAATETWKDRVEAYPMFTTNELSEPLSTIDWVGVAEALTGFREVLGKIVEHVQSGTEGPPPADLVGALQRFNGPLVTAAVGASQAGIPGTGPNGSYTHPYMLANAIAARLESASLPLTNDQNTELGAAARESDAALRKKIEREPPLALAEWVRELTIRRAFLDHAEALLTEEQRSALGPPAVRHRLGLDLFSEGLAALGRVQPAPFRTREDLAARCTQLVNEKLGIPDGEREAAAEIVRAWVEGLPAEHLRPLSAPFERSGHPKASRVLDAARDQLTLLGRLDGELTLDEASRKKLRELSSPLVPMRIPE